MLLSEDCAAIMCAHLHQIRGQVIFADQVSHLFVDKVFETRERELHFYACIFLRCVHFLSFHCIFSLCGIKGNGQSLVISVLSVRSM